MRKQLVSAAFIAASLVVPMASYAKTSVANQYLGKIVIDVAHNGEAWYVSPATHMRVYLGRPEEALVRLEERANYVAYGSIVRVADSDAAPSMDEKYASDVAGTVLSPDDLLGASWYVDPVLKLRRPLATSHDAWRVMQSGVPVTARELAQIPVENPEAYPRTTDAQVKTVDSADEMTLVDGAHVRILNVETPSNPDLQSAAKDKIKEKIGAGHATLERDVVDHAKDGDKLRHIFAGDVNIGFELIRNGLAFHNITHPNFRYAEQYIVGQLDAQRLKKGFWNNPSNQK